MGREADIGVVGLAVMGENIILNMESKGFTVACFNRTVSKVDNFVNGRGKGKNIIGCRSVEELAANLKKPRRVLIMVKAGSAVDSFIETLLPHLEKGDIVMDGGNSHFMDTVRRAKAVEGRGFLYIGTGVSGGEEGALKGPAIMPGGSPDAWPSVKPILQTIAGKADDGQPCCEWMGSDGAGHFVKMVHNGIEYGDMQLICEAYNIMVNGLGMTPPEISKVFGEWNEGELKSYLIEITRDILATADPETGKSLVDMILDTAGQKGTGKWTSQAGLDLGIGIPQIAEAVFARCLSAVKEERVAASKVLTGPSQITKTDKKEFVLKLRAAVHASKICSYAQGFQLLRAASVEYGWGLKFGEIAMVWREGCIIRAQFLGKIKQAFSVDASLANLLLDPYFRKVIADSQDAWRDVVKTAIDMGIPIPAMGSALSYYDSYRSDRLPAKGTISGRIHTSELTSREASSFIPIGRVGVALRLRPHIRCRAAPDTQGVSRSQSGCYSGNEGERHMGENVLVAQSGGPSPVINSSLRGVIDGCRSYASEFATIYGGWHGIEGILKEELLDLSAQPEDEIALLATTPAAGSIGTCRYKLKDQQERDFERVVEVLKAHEIGYFFYIGGNDSMDTANKVSQIAAQRGLGLIATGVPKTIDNDVGDSEFKLIDHTPGYGSVARYWACCIQNANEENAGACPSDPVLVVQMMGRKIGFIPAAARLGDPDRRMPLQIYMPESGLSMADLADNVNDELKRSGRCVVALSEGFEVGDIGARKDSFGHIEYGASNMTAQQAVVAYLNEMGLSARGAARGNVAGTDQRDTMVYASVVDLDEAYKVGRKAAELARSEGSGWMATILREPGDAYAVRYDKVPLEAVANSERMFPREWLSESGVDVTDEFVAYAKPLIGTEWAKVPLENGLQRFARLTKVFAEKKCREYVPEAYGK